MDKKDLEDIINEKSLGSAKKKVNSEIATLGYIKRINPNEFELEKSIDPQTHQIFSEEIKKLAESSKIFKDYQSNIKVDNLDSEKIYQINDYLEILKEEFVNINDNYARDIAKNLDQFIKINNQYISEQENPNPSNYSGINNEVSNILNNKLGKVNEEPLDKKQEYNTKQDDKSNVEENDEKELVTQPYNKLEKVKDNSEVKKSVENVNRSPKIENDDKPLENQEPDEYKIQKTDDNKQNKKVSKKDIDVEKGIEKMISEDNNKPYSEFNVEENFSEEKDDDINKKTEIRIKRKKPETTKKTTGITNKNLESGIINYIKNKFNKINTDMVMDGENYNIDNSVASAYNNIIQKYSKDNKIKLNNKEKTIIQYLIADSAKNSLQKSKLRAYLNKNKKDLENKVFDKKLSDFESEAVKGKLDKELADDIANYKAKKLKRVLKKEIPRLSKIISGFDKGKGKELEYFKEKIENAIYEKVEDEKKRKAVKKATNTHPVRKTVLASLVIGALALGGAGAAAEQGYVAEEGFVSNKIKQSKSYISNKINKLLSNIKGKFKQEVGNVVDDKLEDNDKLEEKLENIKAGYVSLSEKITGIEEQINLDKKELKEKHQKLYNKVIDYINNNKNDDVLSKKEFGRVMGSISRKMSKLYKNDKSIKEQVKDITTSLNDYMKIQKFGSNIRKLVSAFNKSLSSYVKKAEVREDIQEIKKTIFSGLNKVNKRTINEYSKLNEKIDNLTSEYLDLKTKYSNQELPDELKQFAINKLYSSKITNSQQVFEQYKDILGRAKGIDDKINDILIYKVTFKGKKTDWLNNRYVIVNKEINNDLKNKIKNNKKIYSNDILPYMRLNDDGEKENKLNLTKKYEIILKQR